MRWTKMKKGIFLSIISHVNSQLSLLKLTCGNSKISSNCYNKVMILRTFWYVVVKNCSKMIIQMKTRLSQKKFCIFVLECFILSKIYNIYGRKYLCVGCGISDRKTLFIHLAFRAPKAPHCTGCSLSAGGGTMCPSSKIAINQLI